MTFFKTDIGMRRGGSLLGAVMVAVVLVVFGRKEIGFDAGLFFCISVFLLIMLQYRRYIWSRVYYFTQRFHNKRFVFAGVGSLMMGLMVFILSLFEVIPLIVTIILLCISVILAIPRMCAHSLFLLKQNVSAVRKCFLYYYPLSRIYIQGSTEQIIALLQTEKDALSFGGFATGCMLIWIQTGVISPLSIIKPTMRYRYNILLLKNKENDAFVSIKEKKSDNQGVILAIRCQGSLIADDLVSHKPRAKLYAYLATQDIYLRSFVYHKHQRSIMLQYFSDTDGEYAFVRDIIRQIDTACTEENIHNHLNEYPHFLDVEVLDTDPETQDIYTVKISYRLPRGLSSDMIDSRFFKKIAAYVRLPLYEHTIKAHQDLVDFYVQIKSRPLDRLHYTDFPKTKNLRFPLGFDLKLRKPLWINFSHDTVQEGDYGYAPHYIIAGVTGSGKSNLIKGLILQIIRSLTPKDIRFFLVDPKVVTFSVFKKLPHLYAPVVSASDKVSTVLDGIIKEVERRYEIMDEYGVDSIIYLKKKKPDLDLPYLLVIIDEFADIIDSHDYQTREDIILQLKKLGQKSRAAGVHLILMTQRATSQNIDGEIKANMSGRISMKVASEGDAFVIVDDPAPAHIERAGEGYAVIGDHDGLVHFQAPFVSDDDIYDEIDRYRDKKVSYLDQNLSQELLKKTLSISDVTIESLSITSFPHLSVGINLESHASIDIHFSRNNQKQEEEPTPHILIAGATNSGKSRFAKLLIHQLACSSPPSDLQILLVDPKVVTFSVFRGLPHLYTDILSSYEQLLPTLQEIMKIIDQRYHMFADVYAENIDDYRTKMKKKKENEKSIQNIVIVIDEFADLMDNYDYKQREEVELLLKRFGQKARAAGVHLILLTQRATSTNIPGEIRTHLTGKISFRMNTEADSFYLLEEAGAEKIRHAGIFKYKQANGIIVDGYAPLLDNDYLKEFVSLQKQKYL